MNGTLAALLTLGGAALVVALVDRDGQNPQFFAAGGVVHPMRKTYAGKRDWGGPYSEHVAKRRASERQSTGQTAADQQIGRQFEQWSRREERKQAKLPSVQRERAAARLEELTTEREFLRERIKDDGARRFEKVVGISSGETDRIPLERARKLTGKNFGNSRVEDRHGHKYVMADAVLDWLADEAGYPDSDALLRGVERLKRDRLKVRKVDEEIRETKARLRALKAA